MFADQFISPKFDESAVGKEINAVNSEAVNSLNNDGRRIYQVDRLLCDQDCPRSNFSTGNHKTLNKPGLRDAMIKYFEKYYSSSIMNMCIVTNKDLDTMEKVVVELFSGIKNKEVPKVSYKSLASPWTKTSYSQV